MKEYKKFSCTLLIGAVALIAQFIFRQPQVAFAVIVLFGGLMALSMLKEMIQVLRSGKYGVDILAITAIVATLMVGEYWASLMVLIMLTGGDSLEEYASKQAGRELRSLLDNSPQIAHRVKGDELEDIPVEAVTIGDILSIKPREVVPVDGIILTGESLFDVSSLTGEAQPIEKTPGDEVMSGSLNGDDAIRFKVTQRAEDSQYQILVRLVKTAAEKPAHFVRLADRYAVPFTLIAYFIGGMAWFISNDPVRFAEVLVVASPCPLILAAPVALVAGMSRSSRNGIVVKTGTAIEKLAQAKSIAFDKTGTITAGKLAVASVEAVSLSPEILVQLAASAEQESTHILASSLVTYAKEQKIALYSVDNLSEVTGQGIRGVVQGQEIAVGKACFVGGSEETQDKGKTVVFISIAGEYAGKVIFRDLVRPEAKKTISGLESLGLEQLVMMTGDQKNIADKTAEEVGIHTVYADCLPQDKLRLLQDIKEKKGPVIMVGDGVNDAPALALADVGIAMGAHGSTAASESADAVILKDDLTRVAVAVAISKETMRIAKQSVLIGIFICVGLMLIASTGVIPALLGALLQEVVDTISIVSALRARNDHPKKTKQNLCVATQKE